VAWWFVTFAGGKTQSTDEFLLEVREHAPGEGMLCTLDQVRSYLGKPGEDREQDSIVNLLRGAASRAIINHAGREFAPPRDGEQRRFRAYPTRRLDGAAFLDLHPYDLRAVAAIVLDPDGAALELGPDEYALDEDGATPGVFWALRLARLASTSRFGFTVVEIEGDWGYPSVPADVQQAAMVTTGIWMRREIQAFSATFSISEDRLERPEALPSAVRSMLAPHRRPGLA
jgi:hypothetical protein